MQAWILDYLVCPRCYVGELAVERRDVVSTLASGGTSEEILVTGVLGCDKCEALFPVVDEAPRLLPFDSLTPLERDVVGRAPSDGTRREPVQERSQSELDTRLRETILANYGRPTDGPTLRRALSDLDYQRTYAERRIYQMEMLRGLVASPPRVILDVGGGIGGNLRAAQSVFPLRRGIVVDLNETAPPFFQTGDRRLAYVRADATSLPFRTACFDLVISSFVIEHVAAWTDVVDEIARVGEEAFVAFGPNLMFPIEIGHVDAPLAHCLPVQIGSVVAYLWGLLTNNRRSYAGTAAILQGMNYISSSRYYSYCQQQGYAPLNLFPAVVEAKIRSSDPRTGLRLSRFPRVASLLARSMARLGAEPNIYSRIQAPHSRGGTPV